MKKTTELSTKTEEENAFVHYQKRHYNEEN